MENNTIVLFVIIENGEYEDEEYRDYDADGGDGDGGDGDGDDDGMAEAEVGCAAF